MPASPSPSQSSSAADLLRAEARRLHRQLTDGALSSALPVLRRLQRAGVLPPERLPVLYAARQTVQRKHLLRLLALEAGFDSWEACARALQTLDPQVLAPMLAAERGTAELKLWFAEPAQAHAHALLHGGQAVALRGQGVVLTQASGA